MKRLYLLTFILCLFRLGAVAQTLIDGIYYNLDAFYLTAAVTSTPDGVDKYSGSITIPENVIDNGKQYSVTSIGNSAFDGCSGLTSITIPNSVTSIGNSAFDGCSGLTSLTIPNSVTSIGRYAFDGCSGLTSITIPNSVTSIGNYAFQDCSGLTSIEVEEGNPVYDSRESCNAIIKTSTNELIAGCKTTIIPNSVTAIGENAFYGCSGLTSFTIPNSVTSIRRRAFDSCSGLTSITIPNSVTSIASWAFGDCSALTSIEVEEGNPVYDSRESCNAIINTSTNALIAGCETTIIPNSVTAIENFAFYGCSGLTALTIPNSVTSIGLYAFYGCYGLTAITIPNSVTSIGNYAFQDCSSLTSLTIPNSVTDIYVGAFRNCYGLTKVQMQAITPPSVSYNTFDNCFALRTIFVPTGCKSAYNKSPWNKYTIMDYTIKTASIYGIYYNVDLFNETASVAPVPDGEAAYIGNIEIPEKVIYGGSVYTVTAVDDKSFYGCAYLKAVTIPGSVESIGQQAFYYCKGLTSISIPASVTSIGMQAFARSGLTSIAIPNAVTEIQMGTFYGCTMLSTVTIPNTVTSIGQQAFNGCTSLTSLTIPNSVTSVGDYAFRNCSWLTNIFVKSVTPPRASDNLFSGCERLQTIYVPKGSATVYNKTPWNNYNIVEKAIRACVDGIYYSLNGYEHSAEVTSPPVPVLYTGSLTIPATITYEGLTYEVNSIAIDAFEQCSDLTELTLSTATPPAADPTIFIDCMSLTAIHIPDGSMAAYNCAPWSDYTLVDAGRERLIQLVADVNNYVNGTSKAAIISSDEVIRQANELLDEARADVTNIVYDVTTVQRLQQLRDYLAIGQFAGAENVDISFNRKSNHTGWQSLYVPFDIAYDAIADDFVVAELNNFHQYDDDSDGTFDRTALEVLLLKSGDVIAHHTPYVIRAKETGTHTISLPGATVYASVNNTLDRSSTKIRYVFHGTYQGVSGADMYANNYYAMSNGSLCTANSINADLSAFRWYLSMEDRNSTLSKMPAKIKIVCIDDDTTTAISEVEVTSTDENAPIYDLNGRFVGRKDQLNNLPKGVYIINGKKVLR